MTKPIIGNCYYTCIMWIRKGGWSVVNFQIPVMIWCLVFLAIRHTRKFLECRALILPCSLIKIILTRQSIILYLEFLIIATSVNKRWYTIVYYSLYWCYLHSVLSLSTLILKSFLTYFLTHCHYTADFRVVFIFRFHIISIHLKTTRLKLIERINAALVYKTTYVYKSLSILYAYSSHKRPMFYIFL